MKQAEMVVAGHICLDMIPSFYPIPGAAGSLTMDAYITPGKMTIVGPVVISTGGAVSNTGMALHRLGVPVRLVGKVGDDNFGRLVLDVLRRCGPDLADGMSVAPGEQTSYTVVINPPGLDRMFLHNPGANASFAAEDVTSAQLEGIRLFHFGYPPLMRRMFLEDGAELVNLMRRVSQQGIVTSLDLALPDVNGENGQANWRKILADTLPYVDFFLPSLEETLFMLNRPAFEQVSRGASLADCVDDKLLRDIAGQLVGMGAAVVMLKLGDQGIYIYTTSDRRRLEPVCRRLNLPIEAWLGRECLAPCFKVAVVGTTGAGDCAIAGFLAALMAGFPLEEALTASAAVGACNVEAADATSGVPSWQVVQQRIQGGWERHPVSLHLEDARQWRWDAQAGLFSAAREE